MHHEKACLARGDRRIWATPGGLSRLNVDNCVFRFVINHATVGNRALEHVTSHAIDLIEAAYDFASPDSDWLARLINVGAPVLDHGEGIFAFNYVHPSSEGGGADVGLYGPHLRSLPPDFLARFEAARAVIPPEVFHAITFPGFAGTWLEASRDYPDVSTRFVETLGYSDLFAIFASDPNGVGIFVGAPLPAAVKPTRKSRELCQMLGAHIASAFRLRQGLKESHKHLQVDSTGLPFGAEAVFDVNGFRIVHSVGPAKEPNAAEVLRAAARNVDAARGDLRNDDPQQALKTWTALVRGRWSMLDWFDIDGRRYILAMPNPPEVSDPRGLTEQECQVVAYVKLGEVNKLIAYRLGLSPSRISTLLRSAMRKLGVKSRAGLVQKLRALGVPAVIDDEPTA